MNAFTDGGEQDYGANADADAQRGKKAAQTMIVEGAQGEVEVVAIVHGLNKCSKFLASYVRSP